ncbi:putative Pectate disaccharide-lyase [uncultured Paludibacter sp.]|nr:putative Pectate disaccharide-lyase [uncultured Paludibacter sp.]
MKKILLIASLLLANTLLISAQKVWNFSETTLFSAQTFTTTTTIDGLTIVASADKTIVIDGNNKSIDDYSFTQRLKLGGSGTVDIRNVNFAIPTGDWTITVYGMGSSSGVQRTLVVSDGTSEISTFVNDGTAIGKASINYTNTSESTLYMYSLSSGFNIYLIKYEDASLSRTEDVSDSKQVVDVQYFDVLGKKINSDSKGLVIKKITYEDGTAGVVKTYIKSK